MKKHPRKLNSYSSHLPNVTLEDAHFMHYKVKGHLIPDYWDDSDIVKMYDGYFKRMWGYTERDEYCRGPFEKAWRTKLFRDEEELLEETDTCVIRGYD